MNSTSNAQEEKGLILLATTAAHIPTAADSNDYYMEAVIHSRVTNYLFHVTIVI